MQSDKGNLFTRDDTFFGVCEGLGEDLGIPSNIFRMAFALGFFFSPTGAVITYAALGAFVLVTRILLPGRPWFAQYRAARRAASARRLAAPAAEAVVQVEEQPQLAKAA
jgi:phage shock protein C